MNPIIEQQIQTEQSLAKRQAFTIIHEDILKSFPMDIYSELYDRLITWLTTNQFRKDKRRRLKAVHKDYDRAIDAVIAVVSMDKEQTIQKAATRIGHRLNLPDPDAVRTGAELLAVLEYPVYEIVSIPSEGTYIVSNIELTSAVKKQLNALQYLPPTRVIPRDWTTNHDGGYYSHDSSIILGVNNDHIHYQAYDAINALQHIAWELDETVLDTEKNPNIVQRTVGKRQYKNTVDQYRNGIPFYFPHKYDKRGRIYCCGYDINIQGMEYHKACLNFHDKEPVNDTGIQGMKIAIAGHAGQDKQTWQDRIDWFNAHYPFDPGEVEEEWDEPILGRKAIHAYEAALQGKPIGYAMGLDATSSGIQIMSILANCPISAKTCNLINTGRREDLYQMMADKMNRIIRNPAHRVTRKLIKKPVMTACYNSKAVPRASLNEEQYAAFNRAFKGVLPGVLDAMNIINAYWQLDSDLHMWTMPDKHVVRIPVTEMTDMEIQVKELQGIKFKYRYMKQQPSDNYRSLAPNITHSVDAYVCREMIRRSPFNLATIHDCFYFHPNYWMDVCRLYREICAEIADTDLLGDILSQISKEHVVTREANSYPLGQEILRSEYALS